MVCGGWQTPTLTHPDLEKQRARNRQGAQTAEPPFDLPPTHELKSAAGAAERSAPQLGKHARGQYAQYLATACHPDHNLHAFHRLQQRHGSSRAQQL